MRILIVAVVATLSGCPHEDAAGDPPEDPAYAPPCPDDQPRCYLTFPDGGAMRCTAPEGGADCEPLDR